MVLMGAMVTFYKTVPAIVFWQWLNQSFNALVNYTNRNAESDLSVEKLGLAYVSATASALGVALGLNKVLEKTAPPIIQRFVPLFAVGAANCVRERGECNRF
jgi:ABC-type nitrate/sulfonate/bicarbonate transport system permease component